jgi:decaprenylphospho-beta-D-ribofuranose 2-oxidase
MNKRISNWGNYPVIETNEKSFTYDEELQQLLLENESFIPRGNGRCYGDASLSPTTISTLKYDKILFFDKILGIFECQSGLTLDEILDVVVPAGWFLPVTPGTKFITVGGAVASDIHGKNHHTEGSFSNHIHEMEILLSSGNTIICSPGLNSDLFEATCGGMGLTGIIMRVKFKLKKIETSYIRQKQIKAENLQELIGLFDKYKEFTYSVAWIDCLKRGKYSGRGILILGEHASLMELNENKKKEPLKISGKKQFNFPFYLPSWSLNTFTVKVFNFLFYGKNLKKEINNLTGYESFFYPLDIILHWNRGYGKKGFVQYQFVIQLDSKDGLIEILQKIGDKGMGSFLVVLKVFGKQESIISFPKEGYTLALDFPVRTGLFEFLDELDQIVTRCGGRIYMSKDARMKPEVLREGYPDLESFKEIVRKYDPSGKIRSNQSDRLFLTTNK